MWSFYAWGQDPVKRMSGLAVEIGSRGRHVTFVLLQDAEGMQGWVSLHDRDPIPELGDRVDIFSITPARALVKCGPRTGWNTRSVKGGVGSSLCVRGWKGEGKQLRGRRGGGWDRALQVSLGESLRRKGKGTHHIELRFQKARASSL